MSVKVKICGLSTLETVDAAVNAGADFIGLVFFPKSPRKVSIVQAAELANRARGKTKIVALTVDGDNELLTRISRDVGPDFIQAHGQESPARVKEINALTGKPVIKAISVGAREDIKQAELYLDVAAWPLFDAKAPTIFTNALPGGNGLTFDWNLIGHVPAKFMLSGGLTPENIVRAIAATGASMVDVSSGVESSPGTKDIDRIRAFVSAAKSAVVS